MKEENFKPGPFYLGRASRPICLIAFLWICYTCSAFLLPTLYPIKWNTFNYAPVALGICLGVIMLWWVLDARRWFKGPVRNIDIPNHGVQLIMFHVSRWWIEKKYQEQNIVLNDIMKRQKGLRRKSRFKLATSALEKIAVIGIRLYKKSRVIKDICQRKISTFSNMRCHESSSILLVFAFQNFLKSNLWLQMDVTANVVVKVVWYKKIDSLRYVQIHDSLRYVQIHASLSVDERILSAT